MPTNRNDLYDPTDNEQVPRRPVRKSGRKKPGRTQQYMMLGAFALAAVLLVVCIVMIINTIVKQPAPVSTLSTAPAASGGVSLPQGSTPQEPAGPVNAEAWNLRIVSPALPLSAEAEPELTNVVRQLEGASAVYKFDSRAVANLNDMMAACNNAGNNLNIVSGYRGFATQTKEHDYYVRLYEGQGKADAEALANQMEPPAGQSDHHTGLAVDFLSGNGPTQQVSDDFAQSAEYAWLVANAQDYGFILRYPQGKEAVTGLAYQPYHWRFVGVEEAKQINSLGITLEEYVAQQGGTPAPQPDATEPEEGAPESTPAA